MNLSSQFTKHQGTSRPSHPPLHIIPSHLFFRLTSQPDYYGNIPCPAEPYHYELHQSDYCGNLPYQTELNHHENHKLLYPHRGKKKTRRGTRGRDFRTRAILPSLTRNKEAEEAKRQISRRRINKKLLPSTLDI